MKKDISFFKQIPKIIFIDGDGNETLSYILPMKAGKPMPKWLQFENRTLGISGIPTKAGEYKLIKYITTVVIHKHSLLLTIFIRFVEYFNFCKLPQLNFFFFKGNLYSLNTD